jgi:hypothetical protein
MINDDYDYDDELNDLRLEDRARRRYENALMRNPDCRDPDHPGCESCEENEDE